MYTPSILDTPLRPTGPVDATKPEEAVTGDWPMLDDGEVQIGIWSCTRGQFTATTGDENETMFMVSSRQPRRRLCRRSAVNAGRPPP